MDLALFYFKIITEIKQDSDTNCAGAIKKNIFV